MNKTRVRNLLLLTSIFTAQVLMACATISTNNPGLSHTPGVIESPGPPYAAAQATLDYGQSQLSDLSRQATVVGLNMLQAANAAALSTQDSNQRQKLDLDYQSTLVSLNIAQAAATQAFILQQTKIAQDVTSAAQNQAATAAQEIYLVHVTQTAHVQAVLDLHVMQTDQSVSAQTAFPLTATPLAVIQAALLMQEYDREQQTFINQIVIPAIPILIILDTLLIIPVIILAYRRYIRLLRPRRLYLVAHPPMIIDQVFKNNSLASHRIIPPDLPPVTPSGLPDEDLQLVEIMDGAVPFVALWIEDVENQLAKEDGRPLL
jgi:hypothetical protein